MGILTEWRQSNTEVRRNVIRRVVTVLLSLLLMVTLLFLSAGSTHWPYGWLYLTILIITSLAGTFFIPLNLIAERGARKENVERWDKQLSRILLIALLAMYIVAGLDYRWQWSPNYALIWHLLAALAICIGWLIIALSMKANHYFSTAVRLQFDRGHQVCSNGPYRIIRHPGYLGMILYYGLVPLLLGALWALIPSLLLILLFVVRTVLEDHTLQRKLPGYSEYASQVKYRLIPGLF